MTHYRNSVSLVPSCAVVCGAAAGSSAVGGATPAGGGAAWRCCALAVLRGGAARWWCCALTVLRGRAAACGSPVVRTVGWTGERRGYSGGDPSMEGLSTIIVYGY